MKYVFEMAQENPDYSQPVYRKERYVYVFDTSVSDEEGREKALIVFCHDEDEVKQVLETLEKLADAGERFYVYELKWLAGFITALYPVGYDIAWLKRPL